MASLCLIGYIVVKSRRCERCVRRGRRRRGSQNEEVAI